MDIYNKRPELFNTTIVHDGYDLVVCFDEIPEKKPNIEIKHLSQIEIKKYLKTFERIHNIIYKQSPQDLIVDNLRRILNNERISMSKVKKSLSFLKYNISYSLSYIFRATRRYTVILILFDIIVRLKMNDEMMSIYPLILKMNNRINNGNDFRTTSIEESEKVRAISLNYDRIMVTLSNINDITDKLVFAIYHLFYPRVSKEYKVMYVKKGNEDIKIQRNYYDYDTKEFIFGVNKYSILYPHQTEPKKLRMTKELSDIIDEYVVEKRKDHNSKFMSFNIENKFQDIMKKVYGYDYTTIDMKRIYVLNMEYDKICFSKKIRNLIYARSNTNLQEVKKFMYQDLVGVGMDVKYYMLVIKPLVQQCLSRGTS